MNPETGKAYTDPATIAAAVERGEKIVPVSRKTAGLITAARAARAAKYRSKRRQRDRIEKASRRRNRR